MDIFRINHILSQIEFTIFDSKAQWFVHRKDDGFLIQLGMEITDNITGETSLQKGGKHYISSHAIDDEVVMKAWKACQDFVIHEAREGFKYKGTDIFHPHIQVDALVEFVNNTEHAKRAPMIVEENGNLKIVE